jgi:hypothetical protein
MTGNPFGLDAVNTLRLTEYRSPKKQPWTPKNRDQYETEIVGDPEASVTKNADLSHNRAEPKPARTVQELQRWERKDAAYALLQQRIRDRAAKDMAQPWRVAYHDRIVANTTLEIIQAKIGSMSLFIFDREVDLAAA